MANIGWIKFGVAADTSQFSKSMHGAAKDTENLGQTLRHLVGAYVGFEALKAGAERMKEYIGSAIEGVSQTKILAQRVGLSAESFGRLTYAAKLAHVGQDEFAVSLEQMNKRLGEVAIEGSGPAADALRRFGLNGRAVANMGTEKAFFTLLQVMEQIHNPAERASVAMDLFGKSGQGMINLVAKGAPEIKALGDEASRLGIALNSFDAAKVEEADQAMLRLSSAAQGFANMVVTQVSPVIVELIDRYMEWGYSGTKSASFVSQGMDWVTTGLGYAVDGVNLLKVAFHGINSVIAEMVSYFLSGVDKILEGVDWVAKQFGQDSNLAGTLKGWSKAFEDVAVDELDAAGKAWDKIGKGKQTVRNLVDDIQNAAQKRAVVEVGKDKAFNAADEIHAKAETPKFSGAMELGSKEAYSTILRARAQGAGMSEQRQIAKATQRGAAAGERSVALLQQMADAARAAQPLLPNKPAAF